MLMIWVAEIITGLGIVVFPGRFLAAVDGRGCLLPCSRLRIGGSRVRL